MLGLGFVRVSVRRVSVRRVSVRRVSVRRVRVRRVSVRRVSVLLDANPALRGDQAAFVELIPGVESGVQDLH